MSEMLNRPSHQLSIEHEAFRLALKPRELELARDLGRALEPKAIAEKQGISYGRICARIAALEQKLRLSRLGLAIFGYYLLRFEEGSL